MAVDAGGNVYVTGRSFGSLSGSDYATIAYSGAGQPLWTNRYDGPGNGGDAANALAVDASGNVVVTGWSDNAGGVYWDYATVAYSSDGKPLWTKRYNGPGNRREEPGGVAVDPSGNVYVTGFSEALGSGDDPATQNSDFTTVKYVIPPIITRQPLSCTNSVGTSASFIVEVAGSAPFTYQWRKGDGNLLDGGFTSGVNTTNLLIRDVQLADELDFVFEDVFGKPVIGDADGGHARALERELHQCVFHHMESCSSAQLVAQPGEFCRRQAAIVRKDEGLGFL